MYFKPQLSDLSTDFLDMCGFVHKHVDIHSFGTGTKSTVVYCSVRGYITSVP